MLRFSNTRTKFGPKFSLIALSALVLLSSNVMAEVKLTLPADVNLLLVNGTSPEVEGGFFSSQKMVTMPDGTNQIAFRYEPSFYQGNDTDIVTSEVIIAKFTTSNSKIKFKFPNYQTANLAKQFNKNPTWQLLTEDGVDVPITQDKLSKEGFQVGRNYAEEAGEYNRSTGAAALTQLASAAPAAQPVYVAAPAPTYTAATAAAASGAVAAGAAVNYQAPASVVQYKSTEEEMLNYWFQKADPDSRARFLKSIQAGK